jgi:hypothetical protein
LGEKYKKVRRKEEKRKKRKMEKNLINTIFSLTCIGGHRFDHVSRGVQERRVKI